MPQALLLLSDDLLMPSRIREGLRPLGLTLTTAATLDTALPFLNDGNFVAVFVNLTARRYDPLAAIQALKRATTLPVLAFAGHVETEKHAAARAAGADLVVANSSVALHLAQLLPRLLSANAADH